MFGNNRRSHELKKKWKDLKGRARISRAQPNLTGGRKDSLFNKYILDILGSESEMPATNGHHEPVPEMIKPIPPDDDWDPPTDNEPVVSVENVEAEEEQRPPTAACLLPAYVNQYRKKKKLQSQSESNWKLEALLAEKRELKIKWLKSEIAKNDSIVELNYHKMEYIKAKKARLGL